MSMLLMFFVYIVHDLAFCCGSFLTLLATGYAAGPRHSTVHVWVPAGLRRSALAVQSREIWQGIGGRPATQSYPSRAMKTHT